MTHSEDTKQKIAESLRARNPQNPTRRGVSATEKLQTVERPNCQCHDEPMKWHKGEGLVEGGLWTCRYRNRRTPEENRRLWLRWKYDISPEQYEEMLREQNYRCPLCDSDLQRAKKNPPVDHDHITGRIRGILCSACNRDIGRLERMRDVFFAYLGWAT